MRSGLTQRERERDVIPRERSSGRASGRKSPRDRSPQASVARSDTTKNHGAAFRPDIFQLHVNMIGGGRSCKSPPRRCPQRARTHHVRVYVLAHIRAE